MSAIYCPAHYQACPCTAEKGFVRCVGGIMMMPF